VRVLGATTTDAGRHRPSAVRPTTPAVRSVGAVYHAVRQLANRLLQTLATTVGDIVVLYIMLEFPFFSFAPVCIVLRHGTEA